MGFGSNPLSAAQIRKRPPKPSLAGAHVVTGDQEIIEIIGLLEPKLGKKAMRKSLRAAAKTIILPEAKIRVPVDTGELEESLTVRAMSRSRTRYGYEVVTRPTSDAAEYAMVVEFGTKHTPAAKYLRDSGYGNERRVVDFAIRDVKEVIKEMNKAME